MTGWSESHGNSNGNSLEMGIILGRLISSSEQQITILRTQIEILDEIRHELAAVPERIAERIPSPPVLAPRLTMSEIVDLIRRAGLSLLPISFTLLILTGHLELREGVALIHKALGLPVP